MNNTGNVWNIIIHDSEEFCTQGFVYETLKLSRYADYSIYGTIHIVINNINQSKLQTSSHRIYDDFQTEHFQTNEYYNTDVAKSVNAPIFHVNADDVEAVLYVMQTVAEYKAAFRRRSKIVEKDLKYSDIVLNEKIISTKTAVQKYTKKLLREGIVNEDQIYKWITDYTHLVETKFEISTRTSSIKMDDWHESLFEKNHDKLLQNFTKFDPETGIGSDKIKLIFKAFTMLPPTVEVDVNSLAEITKRITYISENKLDWILCEALALGSLLIENISIRFSGLDVNRRKHSFSNASNQKYVLLQNVAPVQGIYNLCDNCPSLFSTIGFEVGFATVDLNTLVIWEAVPDENGLSEAQTIIDHYLTSGYRRFNQRSGIVLLIPHYFQIENTCTLTTGRPERFLQLCNDDENNYNDNAENQLLETNLIVANISNPSNYFHILRRQMKLPIRRPLIIFMSNITYPSPDCFSSIEDVQIGSKFQPYIMDTNGKNSDKSIKGKLLLCTGQIYYSLINKRKDMKLENSILISRIEQICPFPYKELMIDIDNNKNKDIYWIQEEPSNQGYWQYTEPRIRTTLNKLNLTNKIIHFIGRSSKSYCGFESKDKWKQEEINMLDEMFRF